MHTSNLYFALMIKFGSIEEAAKAIGVKPQTLMRYADNEGDITFQFMKKIIKALGIINKPRLIRFIFFAGY